MTDMLMLVKYELNLLNVGMYILFGKNMCQ